MGNIKDSIRAILRDITQETPDVKTFRFELEKSLDYRPGHSVILGCKSQTIRDYVEMLYSTGDIVELAREESMKRIGSKQYTKRPYSIATPPTRAVGDDNGVYIEVTIEKKEKIKNSNGVDFLYKGSFSNYMLNAAKEGEEFEIFGVTKNENFVYDENSTRNYLGIAASSGIVPIMCHLRYIVDMNLKRDVVIIYSNRYRPDNIIYRKELESIQSMADNLKYPNFKIKIVNIITRNEDPEWKGRVSRMDSELIRDVVDDLKNRTCFVCGGGKFIQDISKQLTGLGVADDDIRIDMWEKIDSK
ncbi:MAG TPA: hypothetical protein VJH34_00685 [archaeon]|nr:hypothetical protein [archaeon]